MNRHLISACALGMLTLTTAACDSAVMPTTNRAEFERADTNRDRVLNYREFELLKAVKATGGNTAAYGQTLDTNYHKEFGLLDNDKNGVISEGELGIY